MELHNTSVFETTTNNNGQKDQERTNPHKQISYTHDVFLWITMTQGTTGLRVPNDYGALENGAVFSN